MKTENTEEHIEEEYHVSWYIIVYKMLFGVGEFLLGAGIILYGKTALVWYRVYALRELSEDPHDILYRLTQNAVPNVLTHHTFLAFYLTLLGAAKIAGAIGLIYRKNWGVDLLVGLTFIMFPFQVISLVRHPTVPDFLYITVGLLIALYLINFRPHEWAKRVSKKVRRHAKR